MFCLVLVMNDLASEISVIFPSDYSFVTATHHAHTKSLLQVPGLIMCMSSFFLPPCAYKYVFKAHCLSFFFFWKVTNCLHICFPDVAANKLFPSDLSLNFTHYCLAYRTFSWNSDFQLLFLFLPSGKLKTK